MNSALRKPLRVAIGGIWHETNAFAAGRTTIADFECFEGEQILKQFTGTRTPLGGFIDWSRRNSVELFPAFFASATPSATVCKEAYETLSARLVQSIKRLSPDLILLDLHGAMVVENCLDVESDLLVRLRGRIGRVPIGAVLDYHANISQTFVDLIDIVAGYETYPHTDHYDRGIEVAVLTFQTALGNMRPVRAYVQPPLMIPPQVQFTESLPMLKLVRRAAAMERIPGVLNVTLAAGFPYADVPQAGLSVIVTTNGNAPQAAALAAELGQQAWDMRSEFVSQALPPFEAVAKALRAREFPVVLVDSADNIGGGAPGDGTTLLRALLDADASGAVISIADPAALESIQQAGIGANVSVLVGGASDSLHGAPVQVNGTVRRICSGDFSYQGSYMTSRRVHAGLAAVVEARGVTVVIRERKVMPFDSEELRVLGIDPLACHIIVVKSAIAWRAAYGGMAREVIEVDAPGICSACLETLPFKQVRRPVAPLDSGVVWQARAPTIKPSQHSEDPHEI
ncbi:MAG TPA: M81 family metallopeptidase [Planctomycetota bacterium]|nr:M81 family metallopeptidase [Planctomycetota bacterium]